MLHQAIAGLPLRTSGCRHARSRQGQAGFAGALASLTASARGGLSFVHGRGEEWQPGRTRNETRRDGDDRGAHFGAFLSFLVAVGVSVQVDDLGVMDETIDE